jgi:hypothetical protein
MTFRKRICSQCIYAYYNPRDLFPIRQCLRFEKKDDSGRTLYDTAQASRKDETKCGQRGTYWIRKIDAYE